MVSGVRVEGRRGGAVRLVGALGDGAEFEGATAGWGWVLEGLG